MAKRSLFPPALFSGAASAHQPGATTSSGVAAGPNAFEVGVIAYDPDAGILNVRIKSNADAEEIEATMKLDDMTGKGMVELLLGDNRLAPRIEIVVHPRVKPPTFTSPEEADAWLEAHS